ncbi:transcriptional regulator [Natrarchaeobius sp. A-rgal3]|uniref:DUF7527 domain-containing protein n=1 Tax=Natrarchaeobius versutus TaxID=1679078 RepID=UPI00350F0F36
MHSRTKKRVEQWDSRPFSGGYDGLSDLADSGFSGAVSGAGAWLFMLNGRIVGAFDGRVDDFENASGTIYQAPHPSLPLLCSMEEHGGETRANYYTNETPLEEVDSTLKEGSFTGYIELSENVLSGDYYAVYYGGRRMAAAYIGNAERLITGDEAFDRASDEVGIYEVINVDLEVTDVPETDRGGATSADAGSDTSSSAGGDSSLNSLSAGSGEGSETEDDSGSAIDPIDVSGSSPSETASGSSDSTRRSGIEGITADDGTLAIESEPEEPAGITDDSTTDDSTTDSVSTGDSSPEPAVDPSERADPTQSHDLESAPSAGESADETTSEAGARSSTASDGVDDADDADGESALDPDEVEAAAEELDRNDISWTEDDVDDGSADEPVTIRDDDPSSPAKPDNDPRPPGKSDTDRPTDQEPAEEGLEERFEEEQQWRSTRRIPSIDPDNTEAEGSSAESPPQSGRSASSGGRVAGGRESRDPSTRRSNSRSTQSSNAASSSSKSSVSRSQTAAESSSTASQTKASNSSNSAGQARSNRATAKLKDRLEALEERRDKLEAKMTTLESERDELRSENEELSKTVERLRSRIGELEAALETAREQEDSTDAPTASTQLSPGEALSRTNLFVRYGSKSNPTLETAHGDGANREEVTSNLRIEHHTEFDAADTAVDGQPYEEFLTSTMEYQFVDWLTHVLLYEIRDTGHANGLTDLYDALPRIDRAELDATISLEDDDTENVPDELTFDVVAFDKMGNPLVLVSLNDSREPATREMLVQMEEAASAVKANYPDLAAAIAVTSSYFDPGALEVTEQATSSGFLSRGSKQSYVNLSRKQGYHLCLVESRSEGFHMNVPEL